MPSAAAVVAQVIVHRMPHKRFDKAMHAYYLRSVFRVAEAPQGAPIRDGLLLGVIDRLLEVRMIAVHINLCGAPGMTEAVVWNPLTGGC